MRTGVAYPLEVKQEVIKMRLEGKTIMETLSIKH